MARSTRGHEFEKERRRRRQELIERSLDDFEISHVTFELLADLYSAFCTYDEIPSHRRRHSSSPIAKAGIWASGDVHQSAFQIMMPPTMDLLEMGRKIREVETA